MSNISRALQIKNETAPAANTALRVGEALEGLASVEGWAVYVDSQYTVGSPLVIGQGTTANITINGGAGTIRTYLPYGVTDLYDVNTGLITPAQIGDGYAISFSFKAKPSTNNGVLIFGIDLGAPIGRRFLKTIILARGTNLEHDYYFTVTAYALDTFVANGGQIQITADSGDIDAYDFLVQIHRMSSNG
jgi:hypothetical protein